MRIFYTTHDNGDGSSSVRFFENQECIDLLEEADPETYGCGEGGSSFEVMGITDLEIRTLSQVKEQLAKDADYDA